jgi:hypothetical protein
MATSVPESVFLASPALLRNLPAGPVRDDVVGRLQQSTLDASNAVRTHACAALVARPSRPTATPLFHKPCARPYAFGALTKTCVGTHVGTHVGKGAAILCVLLSLGRAASVSHPAPTPLIDKACDDIQRFMPRWVRESSERAKGAGSPPSTHIKFGPNRLERG